MRRRLRGGRNGVSYEKLGIQNGWQPPDYAYLIRESALSGCSWSLDGVWEVESGSNFAHARCAPFSVQQFSYPVDDHRNWFEPLAPLTCLGVAN